MTHILRGYIDMLLVVIVTLVVIISNMQEKQKKVETTSPAMGSIVATLTWPEGDQDVDLWVSGPGEPKGVGYSNKAGENVDLLRDDMGNISDILPLNYENAVFRTLKEGNYTFNVHCYRCTKLPIRAALEVRINRPKGPPYVTIRFVDIRSEGEEITVINFDMDSTGYVKTDSINDTYQPLRVPVK
jgi:hypothetical protein